jgi:hypothetical protein
VDTSGSETSAIKNYANRQTSIRQLVDISDSLESVRGNEMLSRTVFYLFGVFFLISVACEAQYRGDHIPGFAGLDSGSEPPPGLYVGNVVWVYPTNTVKANNGDNINLLGSITSVAPVILVDLVTNKRLFGGNIGVNTGFPFIEDRIQINSLSVNSGLAYTDMSVGGTLGWNLKRADVTAGYNLYIPTGSFTQGATDNSGLGMWGNEFTIGSTAYLDQKKLWNAAANFGFEFHSDKKGTNIHVGDMGTIEGGFGRTFYKKVSGPIPMIINVGAAGYTQFKITGDSGSDIPTVLMGFKDRAFALGPEFNIFIPKPRLTLLARYEPEFGVRNRTQGQTVVFSIVWVAKSLVKGQP